MDATGVWDLVPVKPSHGERSRWQRHHSESSSPAPRGFNPLAARGSPLARNNMGVLSRRKRWKRQLDSDLGVNTKYVRPKIRTDIPLIACECGSAITWDAPNRKCLYCRRKSSPGYASSRLPTVSSEPSPSS